MAAGRRRDLPFLTSFVREGTVALLPFRAGEPRGALSQDSWARADGDRSATRSKSVAK